VQLEILGFHVERVGHGILVSAGRSGSARDVD
jgi:hypothetical protein